MDHRTKLLKKVFDQGFRTPFLPHDQPPPVVSLEDFFLGNTDKNSIAVNLGDDHPGCDFFYDCLKRIRSLDVVAEVLVNVYDLSLVFEDDKNWPYAENVHVLTTASETTVQAWADELLADAAIEGWPYGKAKEAPDAPPGLRWWSLAWD